MWSRVGAVGGGPGGTRAPFSTDGRSRSKGKADHRSRETDGQTVFEEWVGRGSVSPPAGRMDRVVLGLRTDPHSL